MRYILNRLMIPFFGNKLTVLTEIFYQDTYYKERWYFNERVLSTACSKFLYDTPFIADLL